MKKYFITGTDTDIGKTFCAKVLLEHSNKNGLSTLAYKPIAAGCVISTASTTLNIQMKNEDALILQKGSSVKAAYKEINPITFLDPIAPHIAAKRTNSPICFDLLSKGLRLLETYKPDLLLIEGAGGWRLPINDTEYLSSWVIEENLPVILVVGMKLGCINHALLTYETILNDGLEIAGWIANSPLEQMPFYADNLETLKGKIKAPLIAELPFMITGNEKIKIDMNSLIK